MMMKQYSLKLKDKHLRDLASGKGIMISPKMGSGEGGYPISMSPAKHARLMAAHSKGKSAKLMLSPKELKANGVEMMEGGRIRWRDIGRTLRRVGEKAGEFYRKEIRPTVGPALKKLVKRGVTEGLPLAVEGLTTLVGQPEIGAVAMPFVRQYAERISEPVAQAISRKTGAFGVPKKKKKATKRKPAMAPMPKMPVDQGDFVQPAHPKFRTYDNYYNFIMPDSPAFNPPLPADNINDGMCGMPDLRSRMYFKKGSGMLSGLPMEPVLPARDNSGMHMSYL
jgi:hypothetical protein